MIEYNGIYYYSCTEISKMINEPDEDFKPVADKFRQVYSKDESVYIYDVYVQNKLYPAADKKCIRYIKYQKNGDKVYRAFAIDDLMDFLYRKDAKHICFNTKNVRNIELVEME